MPHKEKDAEPCPLEETRQRSLTSALGHRIPTNSVMRKASRVAVAPPVIEKKPVNPRGPASILFRAPTLGNRIPLRNVASNPAIPGKATGQSGAGSSRANPPGCPLGINRKASHASLVATGLPAMECLGPPSGPVFPPPGMKDQASIALLAPTGLPVPAETIQPLSQPSGRVFAALPQASTSAGVVHRPTLAPRSHGQPSSIDLSSRSPMHSSTDLMVEPQEPPSPSPSWSSSETLHEYPPPRRAEEGSAYVQKVVLANREYKARKKEKNKGKGTKKKRSGNHAL